MDTFDCEFCHKTFKTSYILDTHKKTSKRCIKKQGLTVDTFKCVHCDKILTTNARLNTHLQICKIKLKKEQENDLKFKEKLKECEEKFQDQLKEQAIQFQSQLKDQSIQLHAQLRDQETTLKEREKYIKELKEALDKANDTIADIAKMPKTTNKIDNRVNNNTVQIFDINDISKMTSMLESHLTPDVMRRGQEGVADMLKTHLLQTSNGNPTYECTDVSRQKFEFRNADGNMETDPKATKLIRNLGRSGMWAKAHSSGKKLWEKADGSVNTDAMGVFMPNVTEVLEIDKDSSKLRRRLASITARQRAPVVSAASSSSSSSSK